MAALKNRASSVNKLLQREDFDQNQFFNALRHFHPSLYNQTAQKRWIVVVPHSQTLGKATLDEDFIQTHLLQSSPYFKEEFITVNGKCVTYKDNAIITKSGFSGSSRKAHVLHEELFYNEDFQSFRVLLVDTPLIGEVSEPKPPQGRETIVLGMKIEDRALYDHVDLIRISLGQNPRGVGELLKNLNTFVREFKKSYVLVKGFCKYAAEKVQTAVSDELQRAINSPNVDEITEDHELELRVAVESFVMASLHDKIFDDLCKIYESDDDDFIQLLNTLQSTKMDDLGVQSELQCVPNDAILQLQKLNEKTFNTPIQKLKCLKTVTSLISHDVDKQISKNHNAHKDLALSTDDLLPLMVFVIIKSAPTHIHANIEYMEYFHQTNMATTELGFHFATFKAAFKYISQELAKPRYRDTPPSPSPIAKRVTSTPTNGLAGFNGRTNHTDDDESKHLYHTSSHSATGRSLSQPHTRKTKGSLLDSLVSSEPLFSPRPKQPSAALRIDPSSLFEDTKKSRHEAQFTRRPKTTGRATSPMHPQREGQSQNSYRLRRSVTAPEVIRIESKEHPLSDELGDFLANLRTTDDVVTGNRSRD